MPSPDLLTAGRQRQRGLALVEFAITAPLILFVFIAVAELGRAFYQYTALTKAVRDGARYLATLGSGSAGIGEITGPEQDLVRRLVVRGTVANGAPPILPGFVEGQVQLQIPAAVAGSDYVRVEATYTFRPLFITIPSFGFGGGDIDTPSSFTASAVMRSLRS